MIVLILNDMKVFNKYIGYDDNDIINNDSNNINIINRINQCSKSQQLDNGTTVAAFIILLTVLIFAAHKHHDDSYKSLRTNTTNAINNIVINRNKYDSITKYTNKQSSSSSSRLIFYNYSDIIMLLLQYDRNNIKLPIEMMIQIFKYANILPMRQKYYISSMHHRKNHGYNQNYVYSSYKFNNNNKIFKPIGVVIKVKTKDQGYYYYYYYYYNCYYYYYCYYCYCYYCYYYYY